MVSSEQNEIQKFAKWDLDIEPHREKMNTQDLEGRFKEEDDPFRFVIVCAMWITGFDVPTLSTIHLDKPLKSHTLMQAIAPANRTSEGNNNGLIVDYIETYKALLDALAIYGAGGGDNSGENKPLLEPNSELVHLLEEALTNTETFLLDEVNFNLQELISSVGLDKLLALDKGVNAVYTNDETKLKFEILAREVFKKYKALQPHKLLNEFAPRRNAIDAIYCRIADNIESADVAEIMRKIENVVDESIANVVAEPSAHDSKLIDLSGLNFELLEKYFLKTTNKNAVVQSLKLRIEKQLKRMVERNPLQVDFYQQYQEIIDDYNRGKDTTAIEETFRKLIEFVNSLTDEEIEAKREGLIDEQKAIFDIIIKPNLSEADKKKIKEITGDFELVFAGLFFL